MANNTKGQRRKKNVKRHYSLFAQSQGSIFQWMLLVRRRQAKSQVLMSRLSLCYGYEGEGATFYSIPGTTGRVQKRACHAAHRLVVYDYQEEACAHVPSCYGERS